MYEDEYLVVINKLCGMVVYFGVGNFENIFVNVFLYKFRGRFSSINGVIRFGIVYRFDKDILGFLIVVKIDEVYIKFFEVLKFY